MGRPVDKKKVVVHLQVSGAPTAKTVKKTIAKIKIKHRLHVLGAHKGRVLQLKKEEKTYR
jgi:hypothetical protein